jgi:hypothetical protein
MAYNLPYPALWQLVHDTLLELPDKQPGDENLTNKIIGDGTEVTPSPHVAALVGLLKDIPKFTEELVILRNRYRGK